jgi:hypothetical protein
MPWLTASTGLNTSGRFSITSFHRRSPRNRGIAAGSIFTFSLTLGDYIMVALKVKMKRAESDVALVSAINEVEERMPGQDPLASFHQDFEKAEFPRAELHLVGRDAAGVTTPDPCIRNRPRALLGTLGATTLNANDRGFQRVRRLRPRPAGPPNMRAPRFVPSCRSVRRRSLDVTPLTARPVTFANGDCADPVTGITA